MLKYIDLSSLVAFGSYWHINLCVIVERVWQVKIFFLEGIFSQKFQIRTDDMRLFELNFSALRLEPAPLPEALAQDFTRTGVVEGGSYGL